MLCDTNGEKDGYLSVSNKHKILRVYCFCKYFWTRFSCKYDTAKETNALFLIKRIKHVVGI